MATVDTKGLSPYTDCCNKRAGPPVMAVIIWAYILQHRLILAIPRKNHRVHRRRLLLIGVVDQGSIQSGDLCEYSIDSLSLISQDDKQPVCHVCIFLYHGHL